MDVLGLTTGLPDEGDGLLAAGIRDVTDDDAAAGGGEGQRNGQPHPSCSSGDDRRAAFEPLIQVAEMGQRPAFRVLVGLQVRSEQST